MNEIPCINQNIKSDKLNYFIYYEKNIKGKNGSIPYLREKTQDENIRN
jgi:hypothetical protein